MPNALETVISLTSGHRVKIIREWILHEMDCIQYDGRFTGPQSVLANWFLPSNLTKFYDSVPTPTPTDSEVVEVLNEFLKDGKLNVSSLAVKGGSVTVFLTIP